MAEPINHDGMSTFATAGSKAAKWGIIGGLGALLLPLGIIALAGLAGAAMIGAGGAGIAFGIATIALGAAAAIGTWGLGTVGAVTGAAVGAFKGVSQVSDEQSAFRARVNERMNSRENKLEQARGDAFVEAMNQAPAVLEPVIQQREMAAYEKGQQDLMAQIQQHMQAEMAAAEAQQHAGAAHAKVDHHAKDAAHEHTAKPPVTIGGKTYTSVKGADGAGTLASAMADQKAAAETNHSVAG